MCSQKDVSFEITITNFATCCRLCFSPHATVSINKTFLKSAQSVSVANAIEAVANVELASSDKLSNGICEKCFDRLNDAYCFIHDIRSNDEIMMSYFNDIGPLNEKPDVVDDGTDPDQHDTTVEVNAVDLVLNEIAPAKLKAGLKREANVRTLHQCTTCARTFLRKSNLIDHQRLHEQVKLFKCDYCSKSFVQAGNLRLHIRTHTAEKPHQCSLCSKSFAQSSTLKTHLKAHANIKQHLCDLCQKAFLTNSDLVKHKLSHSDKKNFTCVLCTSRYFTQKVHLRNHLEKKHKVENVQQLLAEGTVNHSDKKELIVSS